MDAGCIVHNYGIIIHQYEHIDRYSQGIILIKQNMVTTDYTYKVKYTHN